MLVLISKYHGSLAIPPVAAAMTVRDTHLGGECRHRTARGRLISPVPLRELAGSAARRAPRGLVLVLHCLTEAPQLPLGSALPLVRSERQSRDPRPQPRLQSRGGQLRRFSAPEGLRAPPSLPGQRQQQQRRRHDLAPRLHLRRPLPLQQHVSPSPPRAPGSVPGRGGPGSRWALLSSRSNLDPLTETVSFPCRGHRGRPRGAPPLTLCSLTEDRSTAFPFTCSTWHTGPSTLSWQRHRAGSSWVTVSRGRGQPRWETCGERGTGGSLGLWCRGRFCRRAGAATRSCKAGGRFSRTPYPDRNVAFEVLVCLSVKLCCVTHNCTELLNSKSDNVDTLGSATVIAAFCLLLPCSSVKTSIYSVAIPVVLLCWYSVCLQ